MATAETIKWEGDVHAPDEPERGIFSKLIEVLQRKIVLKAKEDKKHDIGSVIPVEDLTKKELKDFSEEDLVQVRIGTYANARVLFGKVFIPASEAGYFHFRANITNPSDIDPKLVVIHTEKEIEADGKPKFAVIFEKKDPLEFFNY